MVNNQEYYKLLESRLPGFNWESHSQFIPYFIGEADFIKITIISNRRLENYLECEIRVLGIDVKTFYIEKENTLSLVIDRIEEWIENQISFYSGLLNKNKLRLFIEDYRKQYQSEVDDYSKGVGDVLRDLEFEFFYRPGMVDEVNNLFIEEDLRIEF